MGCSAALISVGLARNLLLVAPPGMHVLIVYTEILSSQYYVGMDRSTLLLRMKTVGNGRKTSQPFSTCTF